MKEIRYLVAVVMSLCTASLSAQYIAPTDPLTPQQELKTFTVPPGFEIQLVASEPEIQKPMNMNFDATGRLWVTHTVEYPTPAKDPQVARDGISILSEFGPDGRARKVERFADNLNIPIGICPMPDGSCIVWSIPHIWRLYDDDKDGRADRREVLFTGFEYVDTHGQQNGFTYWGDGWIYACHGDANHSKVTRGDGGPVLLEMTAGNVYRFKPDGSAIERISQGQVNPFGLTLDPWGNIYTADCHSRPLTNNIRGAFYSSFTRPHDGLGFGPEMIGHNHGSTAIGGIAYYSAVQFPLEYRDCLFTGNVVTNRVHRDRVIFHGSTPKAETQDDFVVSTDPWFRPAHNRVGPDGALYITDFYNCIIGHYEVPHDHPKRDKHRGRIWRVVYRGPTPVEPRRELEDVSKVLAVKLLADKEHWTTEQERSMLQDLHHPNPKVRRAATEALGRHPAKQYIPPLLSLWEDTPKDDETLIHTIKIALRDHLRNPDIVHTLEGMSLSDADQSRLATVALASPNPEAAHFVFAHIRDRRQSVEYLQQALPYLARNLPADQIKPLAQFVQEGTDYPPRLLLTMLTLLQQSFSERGVQPSDSFVRWAEQLVRDSLTRTEIVWQYLLHPDYPLEPNPWLLQDRSREGGGTVTLLSSHPRGYYLTGVLRSPTFTIPETFSFWMSGHNGLPEWNLPPLNHIRLKLADSGQEIVRAEAPNLDSARKYTLDLSSHAGKMGYVEIVDGHAGFEDAWIAAGGFDPAVLTMPKLGPADAGQQRVEALRLAQQLKLHELADPVLDVLTEAREENRIRVIAAEALLQIDRNRGIDTLGHILSNPGEAYSIRTEAVKLLGLFNTPQSRAALLAVLPSAAGNLQREVAISLAAHHEGAIALLESVSEGKASPRLLQQQDIVQRLQSAHVTDVDSRISSLTEQLPPADQVIAQLIDQRRQGYQNATTDPARGKVAFARVCAACHRLDDTGNRIGPQLDGIGVRGPERLLEDILDPNRNIDAQFRYTIITTKSGKTLAGMPLRTEGTVLVLADSAGNEHRVPLDSVVNRTELKLSLMPATMAQLLSEQELYDLLEYLSQQHDDPN